MNKTRVLLSLTNGKGHIACIQTLNFEETLRNFVPDKELSQQDYTSLAPEV